MREIEFRAYNPRDKKLHYDLTGFEIAPSGNISGIFIDGAFYSIDEIHLMQYTGLKDKNGTKIFEGDIVKIHKHNYDFGFKQDDIGQIKFIDGSFGFYKEISEKEYYFNDLATENGYGELDYYEVIGNIYDNPNLLEEE